MFRAIAAANMLLFSTVALGQTIDSPPIAYMKVEGTAAAIYLARDDGSAPVKLTSTPAKRSVCALDLKPRGGEIAYIECGKGVPRTLKLLNFGESGTAIGPPRTVTGLCSVDTVDYHPSEPRLLVSEICTGVAKIASIQTDSSGYSVLVSGSGYLNRARWLKDGVSIVYARAPGDGGAHQLCRNACDAGNILWTGNSLTWIDVGRNSNHILFDSGGSFIHRLDADTGALQTNFISGTDGHFSPSDADVLYETPHEARGDYLMIRRANGSTVRVTGKGEYGPKDWRN